MSTALEERGGRAPPRREPRRFAGVIQPLRELLGPRYVTFPNITLRRSECVPWHIDRALTVPDAESSGADLLHLQCVIYLQPNDPALGGGLDVIDRSHVDGIGEGDGPDALRAQRERGMTVPADPGNLIVWHGRTVHRSSPASRPKSAPRSVPTKYGIHFSGYPCAAGPSPGVALKVGCADAAGRRRRSFTAPELAVASSRGRSRSEA